MTQISNNQIIVVVGFTVTIILAWYGGIALGKESSESKLADLQNQYKELSYNDNFTLKLSMLQDEEMLNLEPHKFLNCLEVAGLDNVTKQVNLSRSSFPENQWFYGDKKMACIQLSQINETNEIRNYTGVQP